MMGAIIGDVIGARFERNNHKSTDFELFTKDSGTTDDSVCTVAIAQALLDGRGEYEANLVKFGNNWPDKGYGGFYKKWLKNAARAPYQSWGNGGSMRVSPIGWWFRTLEETQAEAEKTAMPTHDHPEGIKGAISVASAIFMARTGSTKEDIKSYIEKKFGYDLSRKLDDIRPTYKFHVSSQKSVPEAIIAFLESEGFEDAARRVVSIGGDTDTLCCICCSIAEAFYGGVPEPIMIEAMKYIEPEFLKITLDFATAAQKRRDEK